MKLRAGEIVLAWFEEEYYRAEVIAEGRVSNKDYMVKVSRFPFVCHCKYCYGFASVFSLLFSISILPYHHGQ